MKSSISITRVSRMNQMIFSLRADFDLDSIAWRLDDIYPAKKVIHDDKHEIQLYFYNKDIKHLNIKDGYIQVEFTSGNLLQYLEGPSSHYGILYEETEHSDLPVIIGTLCSGLLFSILAVKLAR